MGGVEVSHIHPTSYLGERGSDNLKHTSTSTSEVLHAITTQAC